MLFNDFSLSPFGTCVTLPLVTQFGERITIIYLLTCRLVYIFLYIYLYYVFGLKG